MRVRLTEIEYSKEYSAVRVYVQPNIIELDIPDDSIQRNGTDRALYIALSEKYSPAMAEGILNANVEIM